LKTLLVQQVLSLHQAREQSAVEPSLFTAIAFHDEKKPDSISYLCIANRVC
jgi:hypothetical protein